MIKTDLHVHSCLSPCGSDEMTPFDLVGLAKVCEVDLIALTDHNSAKNCMAAAYAAEEYGVGFIPGVEVNTSEDIHCVCLFPDLEAVTEFDRMLEGRLPYIENKSDIFGNQIVVMPDGTTRNEKNLLLTACDISIIELPKIVEEYGGICWPAHVDRDSNGLFAMLGFWPEELKVEAAEVRFEKPEEVPDGIKIIQASDAHDMETLMMGGFNLPLESPDFEGLYKYIKGKEYKR